jgi:signal transduction histidine kinase
LQDNPELRVSDVMDLLEDLDQNVKKITQHGKRADGIVQNMMKHASGTTGSRAPADVNALLHEYVEHAYHGMQAQRPDFYCLIMEDYDDKLEPVELVSQEIGRVFLNMLDNAFYAAHKQERISKGQYIPSVTVRTRRKDDQAEIRFEDNGSGISEENRSKIFEPFFTTKPAGSGTGLGLSLSYDTVVQGHGGTLEVESTVGSGTVFIITLPMKPVSGQQRPSRNGPAYSVPLG